MNMSKLLALPAVLLCFSSCDPRMVYDRFVTHEDGMWGWEDVAEFSVEITDTVSMHNIYLQVRHTVAYPMSNLYMFVHLQGPSGRRMTDTVRMVLARPDGSWTGRGVGSLRELSLLYRKQTTFGTPGTYVFGLEQAMRKPELPVPDVGLRIERMKP